MAMVNGTVDHIDDTPVGSSYLGKRKRSASASPQKQNRNNEHTQSTLQQTLQEALRIANKFDTAPSFLRFPLQSDLAHERSPKRTRLSQATSGPNSIESRIQARSYDSFDAIFKDVEEARSGILANADAGQVNGKISSESFSGTNIKTELTKLVTFFTSLKTNSISPVKAEQSGTMTKLEMVPEHENGQVLHLCIQTEKGSRHLFSGLPVAGSSTDSLALVNGRKLPNGFDLADPATMSPTILPQAKDKRVFGDVFRPHRNLKQLEVPRNQRNSYRSNQLDFITEVDPNRPSHFTKSHFQHQPLPTGAWLQYTTSSSGNDQESKKRQREQALAGAGDYKAAIGATNPLETEADKANALFNSVFSSFAPTADNSKAAIMEQDRNRQWWHRAGHRKLSSIFMPSQAAAEPAILVTKESAFLDDDNELESTVANFEPFDQEDIPSTKDDPENVDDVLEEISALLETLHSYQRIRTLDIRASLAASKPSDAEFDVYEILRSQLSILVASLPPFAIAKLDGDKLNELNISTNIIVEPVDFLGTAQADDFTLRRYSAAQGVNNAAARPVSANVARPPYQTPAGVSRYGSNVGAYGQNSAVPATAAYGQRTAPAYQTPRPVATAPRPYAPQSYQPTTTSYGSQPTVQQFQRPMPNGYGSYNTPAQPNYMQRPAQPSYQPRTQETTSTYGRSVSPNKPMVNGQTSDQHVPPQPQLQRTPSQPLTPAQQHATTEQRAVMERVKAYQQQSVGAGTPTPPTTNGVQAETRTVEATH